MKIALRTFAGIAGILVPLIFFSCGNDDTEPVIPSGVLGYYPLKEGNSWDFNKEYFNESGTLFQETQEFWNVDTCCFYVNKIELVPDTVFLGKDYLFEGDDDYIYSAGGYPFLTTEFINNTTDTAVLIATRDGSIPYEHYIYSGVEELNTSFGNRQCIKTLSIFHYPNQRIEITNYFCRGIGPYLSDEFQYYIPKDGTGEDYYQTTTQLIRYDLN